MRTHAEALGMVDAPDPTYEVLHTPAVTFTELQQSMGLSRLLDLYYNHSIWREVFQPIAVRADVLHQAVAWFSAQKEKLFALSSEKQGLLLYAFLQAHVREYCRLFQSCWIRQGLSIQHLPDVVSCVPNQAYLDTNPIPDAHRMRCYTVTSPYGRWIVVYDRAVSRLKPVLVEEDELLNGATVQP